jgi:hypothetical protein
MAGLEVRGFLIQSFTKIVLIILSFLLFNKNS